MVAPIDDSLTHRENPPADLAVKNCVLQLFVPRIGLMQVVTDEATVQTLFRRALNTWTDAPKDLLAISDELTKI